MTKYEVLKADHKDECESYYGTPTGELMRIYDDDGNEEIKIIFKDRTYTPFGTIRDCGDHYIWAMYSSYTRIDKGTMEVTRFVEDK